MILSNQNVLINYENGFGVLIDSTNTKITKNITFKNNGATTIDYVLKFSNITNTLLNKTKLSYSYTCTGVGCIGRINIKAPSSDGELSLIVSIGP